MANTPLYARAVALNRQRHLNYKVQAAPNHFSFAKGINALPLAAMEFNDAALSYPIAFVEEKPGVFYVVALLGLRNDANLFVDADGQWLADAYVPAFARRYPFIVMDSEDKTHFTVCIDEAYAGVNETEGAALFDAEGKETEYLTGVINFLRTFNTQMEETRTFAARMAELGLLEQRVITISKDGIEQQFRGTWAINDEKLAALDDSVLVELVRKGYMRLIDAHRVSMGQIPRMGRRLDAPAADATA